jgi:hypothetical protein
MSLTLTLSKLSCRRTLRGEQMPKRKGDRVEERVYKSLWHVLIAAVGVYEYRHHKSLASKVLSAGLIAFHVDAAIADALDTPPLSRRILESVRPDENSSDD